MPSEDFTSFIADFGYSWSILFVDGDFDSTCTAYTALIGHPANADIPVKLGQHELTPSRSVVEILDSNWTIIFHCVGHWSRFDPVELAKALGVRVLHYEAEDTSGSVSCTSVCSNGKATRIQTEGDAESDAALYEEASEYAEEMGADSLTPPLTTIVSDYEAYFCELTIQVVNLSYCDNYKVAIVDEDQRQMVGRITRVSDPNIG